MKSPPRKTDPAGNVETWENLALGMASGILLALPFLQVSLFWLHYLALVPWLILLTRENARLTWLFFLVGAFLFLSMSFGPFSALHKLVPFLAALILLPPLVFFPVVFRRIHRHFQLPLTLLAPTVWVATEWLRIHLTTGQTGLFPLGSSQYPWTTLIQFSDLTGMAGISFLVAAANGALVDAWLRRESRSWTALRPLGLFLILTAAALSYGVYRQADIPIEAGPRLALVQPNEVHYRDPAKTKPLFEKQLVLTRENVPPGAADLVVWPENAIDFPLSEDPHFQQGLQQLARDREAAVLAGAFTWATPEKYALHTSAYYLTREGSPAGRYDKIYLIPWAEYVPYDALLGRISSRLQRWNRELSQTMLGYLSRNIPGSEVTVFDLGRGTDPLSFAVPICYEVSVPEFCRRAVSGGADFLVNISSEGFFGAPLYYHMWGHTIFRAVENRIAVARVGNNGISGLIDPLGRAHAVVRGDETGRPYLEAGTIVDRIRLNRNPGSFYTRFGDWFSYLCLVVSVGLALLPVLRRRSGSG